MKIGFVITNVSFSGAQNVFNCVTSELAKRGHEVYILATNEPKKFTDVEKRYYGLRIDKGFRYTRQIKRIVGIKNIVSKFQLECLVAFGFNSNIKGILASKLANVPVIICERMDPKALTNKVLKLERFLLYPNADGYIFQTKEICNFFSKKIQLKSYIIPNPVRIRKPICVANENRDKIIATVTRLDESQKNLIHLIRSYKKFETLHPEYRLLIIGDGPDKELIQNEIIRCKLEKSVELTGRVDNPLEYIKNVDIFTLVSFHEGMPNALIEAMSIGLPCVVEHFSGGAAEELISDGLNGILLPEHNEEALVNAWCNVCENIDFKKKIGNRAFDINQALALDTLIKKWEIAISETIDRNR